MDVEQKYVITFSSSEDMLALNIVKCLSERYGEEAIFQTQVKLGRTDLGYCYRQQNQDRPSFVDPKANILHRHCRVHNDS
jgi:hypothetical protein